MKAATLIALVLFVSSVSAQGSPEGYIGFEYKGVIPETVLANGVRHSGGGLISDFKLDPVYAISQVSKGRTAMLWLEVSTGQNGRGIEGWKVLDALALPQLNPDQHVHLAPFDPSVECLRNGRQVDRLVALGRIIPKRGTFVPQRAWIAEIEKKKFISASIRGLRCTYSEP